MCCCMWGNFKSFHFKLCVVVCELIFSFFRFLRVWIALHFEWIVMWCVFAIWGNFEWIVIWCLYALWPSTSFSVFDNGRWSQRIWCSNRWIWSMCLRFALLLVLWVNLTLDCFSAMSAVLVVCSFWDSFCWCLIVHVEINVFFYVW